MPTRLPPIWSQTTGLTDHMPTPETAISTHCFRVHGRDSVQRDAGITQFMHDQLFTAFI